MNEHASLSDIVFTENGYVDVGQLNALYRHIGWDSHSRRTEAQTTEMLRVSHYYIAAHTTEGILVGFARVCGDPYVAQVLDVITHPDYRRRGIATRYAWGACAPATVALCVRDLDRWQWHCRVLSTVRISGLQRCRAEMGARISGHQHKDGQREIICA